MHISVIIPTHNRAHCLADTLDSVLAQSMQPHEIIVVDDASTDNTAACLKRYPSIQYLAPQHKKPQGVSSARNRGIGHASGDWIALLDSDDRWAPKKLQRQYEAWQQNPEHRIIHTDERWIRNGRFVNPMKKHAKGGGDQFFRSLALCCISPSSVLLRRTLLHEVGLFDETLPACEDYDLWLRITANNTVLYVDEALTLKYGGHEDQLSKRFWGMDRFRIQALIKLLERTPLSPKQREATLMMLCKKTRILLQGALKRDHHNDAAHYRTILRQYASPVA